MPTATKTETVFSSLDDEKMDYVTRVIDVLMGRTDFDPVKYPMTNILLLLSLFPTCYTGYTKRSVEKIEDVCREGHLRDSFKEWRDRVCDINAIPCLSAVAHHLCTSRADFYQDFKNIENYLAGTFIKDVKKLSSFLLGRNLCSVRDSTAIHYIESQFTGLHPLYTPQRIII